MRLKPFINNILLKGNWNYMASIVVLSSAKHIAAQILVIAKLNERLFRSNYWLWTGKHLLGSYWKDYQSWRQDWVYYVICCSILNVNKIYKQIEFELIPSKSFRWISKKFLWNLLQMLILAKKMQLTFKMTWFLQDLLENWF